MAKKQGFAVTAFDAREIVRNGKISSELEMERAVRAERLLRLMSKEHPELDPLRKEVRDLVIKYESEHWSDVELVTDDQMKESDSAAQLVERERSFFKKRKELIIKKLKQNGLNQNDLSAILAHSKSYTSELLNSVRAFSTSDLIIIHRLFGISLEDLICTEMPAEIEKKLKDAIEKAATRKAQDSSAVMHTIKSLSGAVKVSKSFKERDKYRKDLAEKYS